ncbi:dihydroxyacetone kinase subunit DhaL [Mycoplasmopsis caviae]|uniref:Dihydroxyacetone kinase n=1 Tax=Mycoplasmopsis caviae TaxID=55603 RepID=A0A3P8LI22_9BACT|nr:dihydroxyacetone kinase subunit DhaL [Mycoplasmopsis caviae]UUD35287.1 dihydroxyacetone kinase subunit DhaL [Mycoplasmopsis caviae]VDR41932.1 dihydroxyacetone kinase [Mycoplasmopsis caviae]
METKKVLHVLNEISKNLIERADELTELDRLIGDGDHGINIKRGFSQIQQDLPKFESKSVAEVLNSCAMTLMSKVGGSSGPLLATAFMKAAKEQTLDKMLLEASIGIEQRGKAHVGEKTFVDILSPFVAEFHKLISNGTEFKVAFESSLKIARENFEKSKDLIATKGRASYLGERSKGTHDPGSLTMLIILETIFKEI